MNVPAKTVQHAAPGQYLGYALQPVRFCYYLLSCPPGSHVSLEDLDDVAAQLPSGAVILEQTKSALSQNPIADWSTELWKSLSNWIAGIRDGKLDPANSYFRLYVTPSHTGQFATAINSANTKEAVEGFTSALKIALSGLERKPKCLKYLQAYLDASPDEQFALIRRVSINSIEDDPLDSLRAQLMVTVPSHLIDVLCSYAIGAAKEQADELIRKKQRAVLAVDDFRRRFHAFVQRNNLPNYLAPLSSPPTEDKVQELFASRPVFIRQLELIEADREQALRAVSDFLRSSADKTLWAETGAIFEDGLRDWDEDLIRKHSFISTEIKASFSTQTRITRGQLVYTRCSQLQPPLDGRAVPGHFVHGCFNSLANDRKLGWHPDFLTLLANP